MKTVKTFKGLTGKQLLGLVNDDCSAVDIDGVGTVLVPRVKEYANQAQICANDEADYVSVHASQMDYPILVKI